MIIRYYLFTAVLASRVFAGSYLVEVVVYVLSIEMFLSIIMEILVFVEADEKL